MASSVGGSEAPSLDKDTAMADSGPGQQEGIGGVGLNAGNPTTEPVSGKTTTPEGASRKPGQCIPKTGKCPELPIPAEIIAKKTQYYKDHALIGKFLGIWPTERALIAWIHAVWKPKGHYDLQLGAKGFFTVIFFNLEDRTRIFEGGPYFFNSAGLFLRTWKERFNPDNEDLSVVPVWIRLYSLPAELWEPEIMEAIGNTLGTFVKVADQTIKARYTSFARICVYLNIANDLPEAIHLTWQDEVWTQTLDYENLPFRCKICHEHGHLLRDCPRGPKAPGPDQKPKADDEGFTRVTGKKKASKSYPGKPSTAKPTQKNSFEALSGLGEEAATSSKVSNNKDPQKDKHAACPSAAPMETQEPQEEDLEDMEIGDLDLDAIEQAAAAKGQGFVPADQVRLLEEAILNATPHRNLGLEQGSGKDNKRKQSEPAERRGRKSNRQRIADVGSRLIESGQYPTIKAALSSLRKAS